MIPRDPKDSLLPLLPLEEREQAGEEYRVREPRIRRRLKKAAKSAP